MTPRQICNEFAAQLDANELNKVRKFTRPDAPQVVPAVVEGTDQYELTPIKPLAKDWQEPAVDKSLTLLVAIFTKVAP